jgi:RNA polymerase sigma-70 factor (ECF subfamily)
MRDDSELHTRASLLARLRDAGDHTSWQTFVDVYGPVLYRYARRRGLQDADASDVAQEVLAEVARCIRAFEYQPERGRFRDWLGTVLRRRLARFWERQKRGGGAAGAEVLDDLAAPQRDAEWTDEFNGHVLRVALERIRPHFEEATWEVFERAWLRSRPAAETAAELGLSIDVVYKAKSRVLKRLEEEVRLLAEDLPQGLPPG